MDRAQFLRRSLFGVGALAIPLTPLLAAEPESYEITGDDLRIEGAAFNAPVTIRGDGATIRDCHISNTRGSGPVITVER